MALPSNYRRLKSIIFTGTQYIDTGLAVFNRNTYTQRRLVLDFKPSSYNDNNFIYGFTTNNNYANVWIDTTQSLKIRITSSTAPTVRTMAGVTFERHLFDLDQSNSNLSWAWDETPYSYNQSFANNTSNLCLGRRGSDYLRGTVYSFKVYANNQLMRDYVPAMSPSNVAGLYDLTNDVFYPSAGAPFEYEESDATVTATVQPSDAEAEIEGAGEYAVGDTCELRCNPRPIGYRLEGIYVGGAKVSSEPYYSFTVTGDTEVVFKYDVSIGFIVSTFVIPSEAEPFVTVTGGGFYEPNEQATITVGDSDQFDFEGIYIRDVKVSSVRTYSFNVTSDTEIEVRGALRPIPSRYLPVEYISCTSGQACFDTGLVPKSSMGVYLVGRSVNTTYVFGARDTNSNTSTGQLNVQLGQPYIGWNNTRTLCEGDTTESHDICRFDITNDELLLMIGNKNNTIIQKGEAEWVGTRTMYLLGMNNGGAIAQTSGAIPIFYACRIYDNGELVGDYIPVLDKTDGSYKVWDKVTRSELAKVGTGTISTDKPVTIRVHSSEGGEANIRMLSAGLVKEAGGLSAHLVQQSNQGYSFTGWKDSDGNVVQLDVDGKIEFLLSQWVESYDIYASFQKTTAQHMKGIAQAVAFPFAYSEFDQYIGMKEMVYMDVLSAMVKEDLLQRTTSTITVRRVPSTLHLNVPIMLYDSKGQMVFIGMVDSINDNTISVREFLSVYDFTAVQNASANVEGLNPTTRLAPHSLATLVRKYCLWLNDGANHVTYNLINRKFNKRIDLLNDEWVYLLEETPNRYDINFPSVPQRNLVNVEDFIMAMFENYQISIRPRLELYPPNTATQYKDFRIIKALCTDANFYRPISIGTNSEAVQNVSITTETKESTYLVVFNGAGSSLRATYSVDQEGNPVDITNISTSQLEPYGVVAYDSMREKMVMSDENIKNLVAENLTGALYNHKITLDVNLGSAYRFEQFQLGQPVIFFDGANRFNTVLTAMEFALDEKAEGIGKVRLTFGKIRTSLTSKLNRGR